MDRKKKKREMTESQLADSMLMAVLTDGDVELLAIDNWLRASFEAIRNGCECCECGNEEVVDLGHIEDDVVVTQSVFTPDEHLPS